LLGIPRKVFEELLQDDKHLRLIEEVAPNSFRFTGNPKFFRHEIPKRNSKEAGQKRIAWEALEPYTYAYKIFGRRFDIFLREVISGYPHPNSYGYLKGRNTLDNASVHTGAKSILHSDIKNFFDTVTKEKLFGAFVNLGIVHEVAQIVSEFVTIESILPLGLASSPVLANLTCHGLDVALTDIARQAACQYSRYADDLTFSGNGQLPAVEDISNAVISFGFKLNEKKTHTSKLGQAHFVTGLSVSEPDRPRIPKKMKRKLRQELHYANKYGVVDHLYQIGTPDKLIQNGINRLDGTVRYISFIEKEKFPSLRRDWRQLLKDEKLGVGYASHKKEKSDRAYIFVDESEFEWDGKRYLAIALSITKDPNEIEISANAILRKYLADPFSDGDVDRIRREGLHFVAVPEDLRINFVEDLQTLPVENYIAFCRLDDPNDYKSKYMYLVKKVFPHRLMYFENGFLDIRFEENSKISESELQDTIQDMRLQQMLLKGRYPKYLAVSSGSKSDFLHFSAPDFVLGVWNRYAKLPELKSGKPLPRNMLLFERIRDRVRVILNADNGIVFSRKRPFKSFNELNDDGSL